MIITPGDSKFAVIAASPITSAPMMDTAIPTALGSLNPASSRYLKGKEQSALPRNKTERERLPCLI
jgi:hypothetical protein